jgi:hypothetical protein
LRRQFDSLQQIFIQRYSDSFPSHFPPFGLLTISYQYDFYEKYEKYDMLNGINTATCAANSVAALTPNPRIN